MAYLAPRFYANIAPGQKQLIRLTRTGSSPAGQEQAYRIIIDEIPPAIPADPASQGATAAIRLQMRYSVPLFAYGAGLWSKEDASRKRDPKGAGLPQLTWRTVAVDGQPYVEVRNQGAVHARLTDVALKQGSQTRPVAEGLLGYVLPGASMRWPATESPSGVGSQMTVSWKSRAIRASTSLASRQSCTPKTKFIKPGSFPLRASLRKL